MKNNMVLFNTFLTPNVTDSSNIPKVLIDVNKFKDEQKITGPVLNSNFNPHPWFIVRFSRIKG